MLTWKNIQLKLLAWLGSSLAIPFYEITVSLKCKTFKNKTPVLSTKKTLAVPLYDQIKTGRLFQMQHKIVILLHNIKLGKYVICESIIFQEPFKKDKNFLALKFHFGNLLYRPRSGL